MPKLNAENKTPKSNADWSKMPKKRHSRFGGLKIKLI